jgi:hypothetical protein
MHRRVLADIRVFLRQFKEKHPDVWVLLSMLAKVYLKLLIFVCGYNVSYIIDYSLSGNKCIHIPFVIVCFLVDMHFIG